MGYKTKEEEIKKPELTDNEIKDFEKILESYKITHNLEKPLEYYGIPLQDQTKFAGCVKNDILGGAHWSVIAYMQEIGAIGKKENYWFVGAEYIEKHIGGGSIVKTGAYAEFMELWRGLQDLKSRRQFAKDKEDESFGGGRDARIGALFNEYRPRKIPRGGGFVKVGELLN